MSTTTMARAVRVRAVRPIAPPAHAAASAFDARFWLVGYLSALAAVAFWPTRVDEGLVGALNALTAAVPVLTYARIEFSANILMVMPLGFLLVEILRVRAIEIVQFAAVLSLTIEVVQGTFLSGRTQSALDVVAHVLGAALGVQIALLVGRRRPR